MIGRSGFDWGSAFNRQQSLREMLGSAQASNYNSMSALNNERLKFVAPVAESGIRLTNAQALSANTNTKFLSSVLPTTETDTGVEILPREIMMGAETWQDWEDRQKRELQDTLNIGNQKKGIARVPGTGDGDKVSAMLEPGEAILNRKAAGMIGRDKIAQANAKGNQMRAKEDAGKVAALLKKLGMA